MVDQVAIENMYIDHLKSFNSKREMLKARNI